MQKITVFTVHFWCPHWQKMSIFYRIFYNNSTFLKSRQSCRTVCFLNQQFSLNKCSMFTQESSKPRPCGGPGESTSWMKATADSALRRIKEGFKPPERIDPPRAVRHSQPWKKLITAAFLLKGTTMKASSHAGSHTLRTTICHYHLSNSITCSNSQSRDRFLYCMIVYMTDSLPCCVLTRWIRH